MWNLYASNQNLSDEEIQQQLARYRLSEGARMMLDIENNHLRYEIDCCKIKNLELTEANKILKQRDPHDDYDKLFLGNKTLQNKNKFLCKKNNGLEKYIEYLTQQNIQLSQENHNIKIKPVMKNVSCQTNDNNNCKLHDLIDKHVDTTADIYCVLGAKAQPDNEFAISITLSALINRITHLPILLGALSYHSSHQPVPFLDKTSSQETCDEYRKTKQATRKHSAKL